MQLSRIILLGCILLVGCGVPASQSQPTAPATMVAQRPTAPASAGTPATTLASPTAFIDDELAALAQTALAVYANLDLAQVKTVQFEPKQWTSRALGCPAPNVRYAAMLVPGYLITLQAAGAEYAIHTDEAGEMVLCENGQPVVLSSVASTPVAQALSSPSPTSAPATPQPAPPSRPAKPTRLPQPTVQAPAPTAQPKEVPPMSATSANAQKVIEKHVADFAVDKASISVISEEDVEWSSSALGCEKPGMAYLDVITPGFRVVIEQGGRQYQYHGARSGYIILCDRTRK